MRSGCLALLLAAAAPMSARDAAAQINVTTPDGGSGLRLGLLAQAQGEWLEAGEDSGWAQNLYLRRVRLLFEGRLGKHVTLFVDTDSPNVGKAGADGRKNEGSIYVQDLVLTYAPATALRIDGGLLLLPVTYNAGQSAATLLTVDYGTGSFASSAAIGSRVGRDYGFQARSYLVDQRLELRAGIFQGARGEGATRPLRTFGRVAVHVLETQTDFFYVGTRHGRRRLLDLGLSYDRQQSYSTIGADVFVDHPVGTRAAVTGQVDYSRIDGGRLLGDLPPQDVWHVEAGLFLARIRLEPFVQHDRRHYRSGGAADETASQVGVAYWAQNHRLNAKLGVGRLRRVVTPPRTQVLAQVQMLLW